MIGQIRGLGAFLLGMCLWSNVAHAQYADNCTFQPDCAVAAPSCAVSCESVCVPRRPPVRYQVAQPRPSIPAAPVTYEVGGGLPCQGAGCTEIGCAPAHLGCADTMIGCDNAVIGCDNMLIGCDNLACNNANCKNANCLGGAACLANHFVNGLTAAGGAAIELVGGTANENYRRASRKWYYKSFSRHRHLNHPIISPANQPGYGVYQTCWDRFPEEALWCPPCYGSTAADLYTAPPAYPTATPPTKPLIVPPAAPAAEPITPSAKPPAAPPADSFVPTTSAALLYGP